jgi:hypothetical protein
LPGRARAHSRALRLALLPPSKASGGDFKKGANMAIVGATAMDYDFFKSRGLGGRVWYVSLGTQIRWFQQLMPSICGSGEPVTVFSPLFRSFVAHNI